MSRPALVGATLVCLLALVCVWPLRPRRGPVWDTTVAVHRVRQVPMAGVRKSQGAAAATNGAIRQDDRAARIAGVQRDYEEVRRGLLRQYGSEGEMFPGSADALLRQFALLDREKHADLARLLAPEELDELEYRESPAGELVRHRLGGSGASESQLRAVFRLERNFDLRWGYPTDATPASLAAREIARQSCVEQIHATLGDALFLRWIGGPDERSTSGNGG